MFNILMVSGAVHVLMCFVHGQESMSLNETCYQTWSIEHGGGCATSISVVYARP
jgi:uncharacterized beta-barrel protein YwiB (DUF1934 family)